MVLDTHTQLFYSSLDFAGSTQVSRYQKNHSPTHTHCGHQSILDNGLLNVLTVYAPHSGKPEEEKESFGNDAFHLVSSIPQNEMVVLAGDMNGHVGSSNGGYDGMHGGLGMEIGMQMVK